MKITPRDYQRETTIAIWNYFITGNVGDPVAALPTGTGKSVVIGDFLESVFTQYPNQRVLVLTHVKELIQQNYDKLKAMWPEAPAGINSAGLNKRDYRHPIIFAGIGSVARYPHHFGHVDLIIIDECHLVSPNQNTQYRKFIDALRRINPFLKVIGFTATPWRIGQGKLTDEGGIFTDICIDLTTMTAFNRFVNEGYLVRLIPKATTSKLDIDGVHMRGGEFITKELQFAVDRDEVTEAAILETLEVAEDRQSWLVFCSGVEHAKHVAQMLNIHGVPAEAVYSGMPAKQREEVLARFKAGDLKAVTNNNVLTTGFDHPGIDLIVMLRPTGSPVLWVQMLGRGTRPKYAQGFDLGSIEGRLNAIANSDKRDCLVLDYAGNTKRLGPVNDPRIPQKPGKKAKGEAPIKECPLCNMLNHASVKFCENPQCGHEFFFDNKLQYEASGEELIKEDLPVVETFHVQHVTYQAHYKASMPPSMKVTYYSGYTSFNDFVCIQHDGFARKKAERWWVDRSGEAIPDTTEEALGLAETVLAVPTHLRVWTNKKYPEIMAYCYDGTAFGTKEAGSDFAATVETTRTNVPGGFKHLMPSSSTSTSPAPNFDGFDDDIPF